MSSEIVSGLVPAWDFWRDIFSSAQKLVDDYKSASNDARLQEKLTFEKLLPNGFRAVKSTVPAVIVRANLDDGSHTIEYAVTRVSQRDATPVETTGRLRIVLDDAGEPCVRTDQQLLGTPQLVAEFILSSLLIPECSFIMTHILIRSCAHFASRGPYQRHRSRESLFSLEAINALFT